MPLTPQEVAGKVFGPTRMRRGYDEHEVDAFLDEVEAELTRLTTENEQLRRDVEKARRGGAVGDDVTLAKAAAVPAPEPPAVPAAPPAPAVDDSPVEQRVTRMIVLAQQTADAALRDAQLEADRTRGTARAESERILTEARQRVAEELGGLERSKQQLESEVEQLTVFEQEYRRRLRAFLETRLHDLDHALAGGGAVEGHGVSALDAGGPFTSEFVDPAGFGSVWAPEEGGQSGGEPVSRGAYEDGSSSGANPFDTGSEGSRN
jgi:DivIVA domain-containing protein